MTKVKRPPSNRVYHYVERAFSAEGFHSLNVMGAFNEIGYSRAEARRLLNGGSIKIWDTSVVDKNHFEWYKRQANAIELVEPNDVFIFGHPKALIIQAKHVSPFKRLFWYLRPKVERMLESRGIIK